MNLRYIPEKHSCVHTVVIGEYQPEMCKLTLPNLRAYADRIGADFNIINKSVFDGYPPNYERFQVYEMGRQYKYNLVIDADYIFHTDVPDFTKNFDLKNVGYLSHMDISQYYKPNNYFKKDGRNRGIADAMVVSTYLTHDVWTPCPYSYDELKEECLLDPRQVSELWLSINLARFGLSFVPIFTSFCGTYTPLATTNKLEKPEELILEKLKLWSLLR